MKNVHLAMKSMVLIIIAILAFFAVPGAQATGEPERDYHFSQEELTQMLAPLALYPDSLIAQILMAATYPLDIVEAERWLRLNQELQDDNLNQALQEKTWDPSVKSLCHFPDVLFALSDRLDQTVRLGDAFLNQQDEVMALIQELRHRAHERGNLDTTEAQKVIIEREIIRIEPTEPQLVYVPVYNPLYVYGPWWYPAHPPHYWYYPAGYVVKTRPISYRPPVFIGVGLFSWAWFDWPAYRVYVNVHQTRPFHLRPVRREVNIHVWRHNPSHRRVVPHRDVRISESVGPRPPRVGPTNTAARRSLSERTYQPSHPRAERRSSIRPFQTRSDRTQPFLNRGTPRSENREKQVEPRYVDRGEQTLRSRDTRTPRTGPDKTQPALNRSAPRSENREGPVEPRSLDSFRQSRASSDARPARSNITRRDAPAQAEVERTMNTRSFRSETPRPSRDAIKLGTGRPDRVTEGGFRR